MSLPGMYEESNDDDDGKGKNWRQFIKTKKWGWQRQRDGVMLKI